MTRSAQLPRHLMLFGAELPEDLPDRIEQLRRATGLSREAPSRIAFPSIPASCGSG